MIWLDVLIEREEIGKCLYYPATYGGGLITNQPMKQFTTPEIFKIGQITTKVVLKNYSKSQKNHKIENSILLYST